MRLQDFAFIRYAVAGVQNHLSKAVELRPHPPFEDVDKVETERVIMRGCVGAGFEGMQRASHAGPESASGNFGSAQVAVFEKASQTLLFPGAFAQL
jgi:hypothetical protein